MVICFGNICRSPYAAAVMARMLEADGWTTTVTQAGFFGPGRRSPDTAQAAARARGVDLAGHRSRLLTTESAQAATLVIVMETGQADRVAEEFGVSRARTLMLGDLDSETISSRDISDPYGMSQEIFATTYSRIDRCVAALVRALPRSNSAPAEGLTRPDRRPGP
jgi:protein-tyrosine phosphatase